MISSVIRSAGAPGRSRGQAAPVRPAILLVALLLPIAALINSCGREEAQEPSPALAVATMTIAPASVPDVHTYAGTIEGRTRVTIGTKLMGVVASVPFEEGVKVRAGEVVVSIRSDDLRAKQAQVEAGRAEAGAAFANISANYTRIRELHAKKSATQKEMDDMQMAYDMAQARVRSADEAGREIADMLRYADIASPIDGVVVGKYVDAGDLANPGMPLLAVEDTRELRVNFSVPEGDIGLISRGGKVRVAIDAAGAGTTAPGTVEKVNPSGDPASRQYAVQARVEPPAGSGVRTGMYASVTVESGEADAIAIPAGVIVRRGQLDGVYVLTPENEALLRWVRIGKTFPDGRIEILSGLAGGDRIITTADPRIADGVRVGVAQ